MDFTADTIALVITAACRETGDDPAQVVTQDWEIVQSYNVRISRHFHARFYAFLVLRAAFPHLSKERLALSVGVKNNAKSFVSSLNVWSRPSSKYFKQDVLDRVAAALSITSFPLVTTKPKVQRALERAAELPEPEPAFVIGAKVLHEIYGEGTVEVSGPIVSAVCFRFSRKRRIISNAFLRREQPAAPMTNSELAELSHKLVESKQILPTNDDRFGETESTEDSERPVGNESAGVLEGSAARESSVSYERFVGRPKGAGRVERFVGHESAGVLERTVGKESADAVECVEPKPEEEIEVVAAPHPNPVALPNAWAGSLTSARHDEPLGECVTEEFINTPPRQRSALASAQPWVPYEKRLGRE